MSGIKFSWKLWLLAVILQHEALLRRAQGFAFPPNCHLGSLSKSVLPSPRKSIRNSALFATKKKKKKRTPNNNRFSNNKTTGGFGGAAMADCPCGAGGTYSACCSKIHKDVRYFRKATPSQVVLARYTAYARKLPEFLIMSTHPRNEAFNPDLRAWKKSIKLNMYDNFDLEKCTILEESIDAPEHDDGGENEPENATVKFIAEMIHRETGETTSFMETSKFEKAKNSGAWLYLSGKIEEAPKDDAGSDDTNESNESDESPSIEEKLASQL